MPRIVDKDTRLIDIDFGQVNVSLGRTAGAIEPSSATATQGGVNDLLRFEAVGGSAEVIGSFIQFQRLDLSYMTMNNEVYVPTDVSVQRTSAYPLGSSNNANYVDDIEEYIYIFTRPLNNQAIGDPASSGSNTFENMRALGLDRSQTIGAPNFGGIDTGIPTHEQTIYAEKRTYSYSSVNIASVNGGELDPAQLAPPNGFNELAGTPKLTDVTTWGTMSAITGPNLYAYRVVILRTQFMVAPGLFVNEALTGTSALRFPPVNITFLAKDGNYTEGEYLTRLANAMNNIPEGGPTA